VKTMLKEIEDKLVQVLREKIVDLPKENIVVSVEPNKFPAVVLSNVEFKLEKAEMAENMDSGAIVLEEKLSPNGSETVFRLQEGPLKDSVQVESPVGTQLTERENYLVDYEKFSLKFQKAPAKGKNNLKVTYKSKNRVLTLKTLKLKTIYSADVSGKDRTEVDLLAEKVVKAFLEAEDRLADEGIEIKPVGGKMFVEEETAKVQLSYAVEKIMRLEQVVGPIEKIEIKRENV
jgi:hypothetical protein